jgi:hypothetical protein
MIERMMFRWCSNGGHLEWYDACAIDCYALGPSSSGFEELGREYRELLSNRFGLQQHIAICAFDKRMVADPTQATNEQHNSS